MEINPKILIDILNYSKVQSKIGTNIDNRKYPLLSIRDVNDMVGWISCNFCMWTYIKGPLFFGCLYFELFLTHN